MKRSKMFVVLHRLVRILLAEIRCEGYLLSKGMWHGECKFCGWNKDGRLSLIASSTGSIFDGTLTVKRVLWCEHKDRLGQCTSTIREDGMPSYPVCRNEVCPMRKPG